MKALPLQRRTLALLAVALPLLALFVYVVLRSGPLAPVAVTLATVEQKALSPALFGVGTVGTRTTTKIGPTVAGRLQRLDVEVGDRVRAGQVLGAMDPLDWDDRLLAQDAAVLRVQASLREAQAAASNIEKNLRETGSEAQREINDLRDRVQSNGEAGPVLETPAHADTAPASPTAG